MDDNDKYEILESFNFFHPFACLIAGPSQSGKTTLIEKIIYENSLIKPNIEKILYCYSTWQPGYTEVINKCKELNKEIEFLKGLPEIEKFTNNKNYLLILDDLMTECGNDRNILNIFTRDSHHLNISVFLLNQNIFPNEKYARTISLNCQYIILTNNPRDRLQIEALSRQISPRGQKYIKEAYDDAVSSKNYGYLLFDLHQRTNYLNRVQTGIFSNEERVIYREKENQ